MLIVPAIDMIDAHCVRLSQGKYDSCKVYDVEPLEMARKYEEAGFHRLHLVDLDGAKSSGVVNLPSLEKICKNTSLTVDFGGGIKSDADIRAVFDSGASYACVGSIARTDPERVARWISDYGADRIIISADVWEGKVAIHGWKEITDMTLDDLISLYGGSVQKMMCTDITKDGMLKGPAVELYKDLISRYPQVDVIASGGVSGMEDLYDLRKAGVKEVVVGKAIYEKRVTLEELIDFQNDKL